MMGSAALQEELRRRDQEKREEEEADRKRKERRLLGAETSVRVLTPSFPISPISLVIVAEE